MTIDVSAEVAMSFKHVPTEKLKKFSASQPKFIRAEKRSDPFPVNINGMLNNVRTHAPAVPAQLL